MGQLCRVDRVRKQSALLVAQPILLPMRRTWFVFLAVIALNVFIAFVSGQASSQSVPAIWQMQDSGTDAGLRGIFSVDGTVAWASGTGGTVLRTIDGGAHWQHCAIPDEKKDGATLDFRGVQAWDADTAIVMASGPGEKSRLYKTTDGCGTWKLILKDRDKEGFWDAIFFDRDRWGWLLGDPVKGMFVLYSSDDKGKTWTRQINEGLRADPKLQGAFAASNSSLFASAGFVVFGSGGSGGAKAYEVVSVMICVDECPSADQNLDGRKNKWRQIDVPVGQDSTSSGIFAIGSRKTMQLPSFASHALIAVGGDYTKSNDSTGTAAYSLDGGKHWTASTKPPHGYRSTVQWSEQLHAWITAGTNGSDISRDDGKTWQPLDNGNWNALSLPFIVGPKGRIAKLNSAALPKL